MINLRGVSTKQYWVLLLIMQNCKEICHKDGAAAPETLEQ